MAERSYTGRAPRVHNLCTADAPQAGLTVRAVDRVNEALRPQTRGAKMQTVGDKTAFGALRSERLV